MRSARVNAFSNLVPAADEIYRQIERILASEEFQAPRRGRNFLEFVVKETLAGRADFLKAFTIANLVFGREASFDPQNDPVVRVEASRIRKALERYYLVAGQMDDVVITLPKGGYVPHFEYARDTRPATSVEAMENLRDSEHEGQIHSRPDTSYLALWTSLGTGIALVVALGFLFFTLPLGSTWRGASTTTLQTGPPQPSVIVEFFTGNSHAGAGSDIARGLRDDVIGQLAQFDDLVVVSDPRRGSSDIDYALQGNLQLDGTRLRAAVRLVRQIDGAVIWADNFDADLQDENKLAIQGNIARQIADAIAQPYGAIFHRDRDVIARPAQTENQNVESCASAYYSYRQVMTAQSHDAARDCLERATQHFADNAVSWAQLSMIYLDEIRFRHKLGRSSSTQALALADAAVEKAASLAPDDPRVLQALMLVNFFEGDIDEALKAGTAAYAADPDDVEVAGEYGFRLAMSGKWQSGCELLSVALNKGVGTRGYYEVGMALCAFMKGDIREAEQWSRRSDLDSNPMHRLVLMSILGAAGKTDEALREQDWLSIHAPALMNNVRQEISLRLQRPEDQKRFFDGLRASGMVIGPMSER